MNEEVTIVDYGIGNLLSVSRAFEHFGARVGFAESSPQLRLAKRIVLPGVGAWRDGMAGLRARDLVGGLRDAVAKGVPLLGICLGMQMLLEEGEESPGVEGLGFIPGRVVAIPRTTHAGQPHKIPHIGWNEISPPLGVSWENSLLERLTVSSACYFVHSYTAEPIDRQHRLADCYYNGRVISAVVRRENITGCQFHPEKSGAVGLKIIKAFLDRPKR